MRKKKADAQIAEEADMLPEYDFSGKKGVRGKYYQSYRQGHSVSVRHEDGTVSVSHFKLEDGAVMLEPDVRKFFPDSRAVNATLRSLIALIPAKRRVGAKAA
ncbi:MAG: hypothetical protein HZA20_11455 [Nitrospirae bacterium]|nr:hypothetical protein [Nitrospirota bacterium]